MIFSAFCSSNFGCEHHVDQVYYTNSYGSLLTSKAVMPQPSLNYALVEFCNYNSYDYIT